MGLIKDFLALCGFGARTKKEDVPVKSDVSAKVKPDLVADTVALFGVGPVAKKAPVSASDNQKSVVKETGHKSKVSEPRSGSWNIKPGQGGVSPQSKAVASRHDDRHEIDGSVGLGMGLTNPMHPLHPLSPLSPWNVYQDTESSSSGRRNETPPPAPAESSTPVSSHSYSGGNSCDRVSTSHVESAYSSPAPTYSSPSPSSCSDSSSSDSGGGGGGGGGD